MKKMTNKEYDQYVKQLCPKSKTLRNCLWAFCVGGAICTLGQVLRNFFSGPLGLDEKAAGTAVCASLIFLSALLTGLSVYDDIARRAGAGTLVPITGFANAVAAPAVEFKTDECDIIGLSRKAIQFMASMMI